MTNTAKAAVLIAITVALGALGIYVAFVDDPSLPGIGPAGIGMLLITAGVVLVVKEVRRRLSAGFRLHRLRSRARAGALWRIRSLPCAPHMRQARQEALDADRIQGENAVGLYEAGVLSEGD